jgi:glucose/arabinose dehydrogenase
VPSIAPSGLAWLSSTRYGKAWQGSLFTGSLKFGYLARLTLQGQRVVAEEKLAVSDGQRVRDVRQGPDGLLYLLTDAPQGRLLRLLPR